MTSCPPSSGRAKRLLALVVIILDIIPVRVTVTRKLHVAEFPDPSVAVTVTCVVPTLNCDPDT